MLHFRGEIDKNVYPDEEDFFNDLAAAYKNVLKSFYEAGCRYLQLDDTSWGLLCSEEERQKLIDKAKILNT